jgi:hydroxymethylpyrimidine/phosphomethylpyrimidine kinase
VSGTGTPIALTVAGSDSSGGAGIQADLKTFSAFGVYGASVITALTAQNTHGVTGVEAVSAEFVAAQMTAVFGDLAVGAVKTGMLANAAIVRAVAGGLRRAGVRTLVVDPIMVATSGDVLLADDAIDTLRRDLIPLAMLLTPNLPEAARLLDVDQARDEHAMLAQAKALQALGCRAVLIKGGHGEGETALDILYDGHASSGAVSRLALPRVATAHTHGTGCTLSAAIAALLAHGAGLEEAVTRAKSFVWQALQAGRELGVGSGSGPVDHLYAIRKAPPPA